MVQNFFKLFLKFLRIKKSTLNLKVLKLSDMSNGTNVYSLLKAIQFTSTSVKIFGGTCQIANYKNSVHQDPSKMKHEKATSAMVNS